MSQEIWSNQINSDDVGKKKESRYKISPNSDELLLIANQLDIISIESLTAKLVLKREQGGRVIFVSGSIEGEYNQACSITSKPMALVLNEEVEAWYADSTQAVSIEKVRSEREVKKGNIEIEMMDEKDDPEPIIDGQIDIAGLVLQYLSLGIDPYARSIDAPEESEAELQEPAECRKSPFDALKNWKNLKEISKD